MTDVSTSMPTSQVPKVAFVRAGVWVATIAFVIACAALCTSIIGASIDHPDLSADVIEDFGIGSYTERLIGPQLWVGTFFWCCVDILGIVMLWTVRNLFITYRNGSVFTVQAAKTLRRTGWIIFAMAPVDMMSELFGGMILSAWITSSSLHGQIAIDDTDIYAIVIGLVIVSVGHVMAQAARLEEENRSFV